MRVKLTVEYDGTDLIGWQENAQGPSVQSLLQDAAFKFCGGRAIMVAAGRTDAGVHARAMVCHFDLDGALPPDRIAAALNFYLHDAPVCVLDCEIVPDDFHARFSCKQRNYEYLILNRRAPAVLDKNRMWHIGRKLDLDAMRAAAEKLIGNHDFTSFRASECQAKSPIKTINEIGISNQESVIKITISAKSFLHHQVRNIVGTLVEIGLGKNLDIEKILAARDRSAAGPTAPARGLYFTGAIYD